MAYMRDGFSESHVRTDLQNYNTTRMDPYYEDIQRCRTVERKTIER